MGAGVTDLFKTTAARQRCGEGFVAFPFTRAFSHLLIRSEWPVGKHCHYILFTAQASGSNSSMLLLYALILN